MFCKVLLLHFFDILYFFVPLRPIKNGGYVGLFDFAQDVTTCF